MQPSVVDWAQSTNSRANSCCCFVRLIQFRDTGSSTGNTSQELYLAANTTLTMLVLQGDPVTLLQYALALTQMLNSASTGSLQTNDMEVQALVRTAITVCVASTVPVETLQQVQQMAYLLSILTVSSLYCVTF